MLGIVLGIEALHQAFDLGAVGVVVLVQRPNVLEDVRHLIDGVVPPLGSGAMAADALHVHPDFHAAPVAPVDAAVGGLGGDDELDLLLGLLLAGEILVDDVLPAHTVAVLFLNGAHHHDLIPGGDETQVLHDLGAIHGRGHAALLIGAAPAIDDVVGLIALVGVGLPVVDVADAHGVDVGVDGDDLFALAHPADDVAQAVDLHLVIAQLFHLGLDAHDHFLLLAALAGMRDHVPQEPAHIRLIAPSCFFDRFEVHDKYPPSKIYVRWVIASLPPIIAQKTPLSNKIFENLKNFLKTSCIPPGMLL